MVPSDLAALLEMTYAGRGQVTPADLGVLAPGGTLPPDPGSTAEDSALLPIGPPVAGTILGAADVDVYRIDLQGRAALEVRTSGPTDVRGELLDSTGRLILSDDDGGPGGHNLRIRADLEAGIYYVAIAGETGDYAVMARLGDAPDHGATAATSTLLTLHAESTLGQVSPSALLAAPGRIAPTSADVDVFRLDVPLDGTDVTVRSAGGTDVFGQLLDAGGNELAVDAGVGNFRMEVVLDAGTYYVVVTASETGAYRVLASGDSAVCPCKAGSAPDHGGDAESSTLMPIGPPLPGIIDDPDDVDVFRIDLQGSTTLDVRTSGPTDVHGELFDGAGARIAADDDSGPGGRNFRIRADLEVGVYYVAIAGESGDYAVMARLGDAPDHGDTAATSTRLTLHAREDLDQVSPSALLAAPGRIAPTAADVDVFRLDVPENTDVAVRSVGATDVLARLLDSSLNEIVADAAEGNFRLEARLAAGTYYVEVGGRETGTYRVLAWSDAPCDCVGAVVGRGDPPDKEPPVTPRIGPFTESGSFTDSRGRSLRYGYALDEGWRSDVPRGVLIYFHGNATFASQDAALDRLLPATRAAAFPHGLVPVAVVSPETRVEGDDSAVRQWLGAELLAATGRNRRAGDLPLIHELLQSHLDGQASLDLDRVVFAGGSQGSCFVNAFLREYGEHYRGGADVFCGCSSPESLDPLWRPTKEFKDAFRVVVRATTEDFLWHDAMRQYGYYKHTVGLETRGDLGAPGGHCRRGDISRDAAIRWLLDETILPERPPGPRFERMTTLHHLAGLAVDDDGTLWAAQRQPDRDDTKVWRSPDEGATWEAVSLVDMAAGDIDAVAGHLFLTPANPAGRPASSLRWSTDGGLTFVPVAEDGAFRAEAPLVSDSDGRLFVVGLTDSDGQDIFGSTDSGRTWSALDVPDDSRWWITNADDMLASPLRIVASERVAAAWTSRHLLGDPESKDWRVLRDTGQDLRTVAWDGITAYATAGPPSTGEGIFRPHFTVLRSDDEGRSWNQVELPFEAVPRFSHFAQPYVSVLPDGRPLVPGGMHNPVMRDDAGRWRPVHGGGTLGASVGRGYFDVRPHVAVDGRSGRVFVSDGYAVFRLDGTAAGIYNDDPRIDRDGDGVPDVRDAFPGDPREFMDTDGDGAGNARDRDADGDGTPDAWDDVPFDRFETLDTDGDGVGDGFDYDDDGDRVLDFLDDFPTDGRESRDTDGDGVGDGADADADGDRVTDREDAFPLNPHEWGDSDADGTGDNLDDDDDNDGVADSADPDPLRGREEAGLLRPAGLYSIRYAVGDSVYSAAGLRKVDEPFAHPAPLHADRPGLVYPESTAARQTFGYIPLGDGSVVEFMVEGINWMRDLRNSLLRRNTGLANAGLAKVYLDLNGNGDLTDDGGHRFVLSHDGFTYPGARVANIEVARAAGGPFACTLYVSNDNLSDGSLRLTYGMSWTGLVESPSGDSVRVQTVDADVDCVVDWGGGRDYLCVDLDDDGALDCADGGPERVDAGEEFEIGGTRMTAEVLKSGRLVRLSAVP